MKQSSSYPAATTSGSFQKRGFQVKADGFIAQVLSSDVYKRPVEAVLREYYCNAYDSHKAAGNPNPPKVTLPTKLNPQFVVRDEGTGLSFDECERLFSTFFDSTKRDSNEQIGYFGIGSKAGFAIADMFTVECRWNGEKRIYSCFKDEDIPQIAEVSTERTDEPNGITVNIPTNRVYEFQEAANKVFSYFDQKPDINIELELIEFEKHNEYWYSKGHASGVIMGNIFYECYTNVPEDYILVANLGDVSIVPGRESLKEDDKTKNWIRDQAAVVREIYVENWQKKIDECECFWDAWVTASKLGYNVFNKVTYKGANFVYPNITLKAIKGSKWSSKNKIDREYTAFYNANVVFFWEGYHHRVSDYVRHTNQVAVILKSEADCATIGIPKSRVKEPSELPAPERTVSTKPVEKIFKWDSTFNRWEPCDCPQHEFAYVKLHRGSMEDYSVNPNFDFPVYGLTRQAQKIKKVMKHAVPIKDKLPKSQSYREIPNDSRIKLIRDFFPDFDKKVKDEIDKVTIQERKLRALYESFGVKTDIDFSLRHEANKLFDKYRILELYRFCSSDHKDIVKHYLALEMEKENELHSV